MKELLNKKILIVDDEPELLQMVQNALFDAGFFQVYTADTCAKAILLAKSQPVALFLLDVNRLTGTALCSTRPCVKLLMLLSFF